MSKKGTAKSGRKTNAGRARRPGNGVAVGGNGKEMGRPSHTTPAASPPPLQRLAGETDEEREKRLAARKALTLRAFQMTYENRHRRKTS
jgi:hypothetical protein